MLDLKYVRQNQDEVAANIMNRKAKVDLPLLIQLDDQRLDVSGQVEAMRQQLNAASKQKPDADTIVQLRQLGQDIKDKEQQLTQIEADLKSQTDFLPNQSSPNMPIGQGEEDNVETKAWIAGQGYLSQDKLGQNAHSAQFMPKPSFEAKHHLDVAEGLGIVDMKQAAKVSGSRFAYLVDGAAVLENAITQLLSQKLRQDGFMWVDPPVLVKEPALYGTSHFPEQRDQVYEIKGDNVEEGQQLFLVGSSEPSLFAFGMDRTFTADQLPLKMFAVTPCFRSEVGSWGKDVRGIKRVHQFTKLEMDVIATPDQSDAIFAQLLDYNEWLLQQLGLSYHIIHKCTGDCGYLATYDQFDVEVWMPSQQQYMETMTDTHATDYQSRRLNIKVDDGQTKQLAHTVNDTGVALGRMVAAILDNYQQPDGTVTVPEALRPWIGQNTLTPNKLA